MKRFSLPIVVAFVLTATAATAILFARQQRAAPTLGDGLWTYETYEKGTRIRVSVVTKGLSHLWSIAFFFDGSMLVTERLGRLRIICDGVFDPQPIVGLS